MNTKTNLPPEPSPAGSLREKAEAHFRMRNEAVPENVETLSPEELRTVLHELRVHQIELEMQNEELRHAQEALDAARARYFELFDLAPVGYVTVSEAGMILESNLTAASLLGLPRGELVKRRIGSVVLPEDQDIYYLTRRALLEAGHPQTCALRLLKADGAPIWVRMHASLAADGSGPILRISFSDISEMRRSYEQLRRSEEIFRTVADYTYDWEYWQGADGRLIYLSPSCERITGYPRENFLENNSLLKAIVHPEDAELFAAHLSAMQKEDSALLREGRAAFTPSASAPSCAEVDFRIIKKDGSVAHLVHGCQPVFDASGAYSGRRVSNRDATVRRQAENALQKKNAEMEAFTNTVSHDLKSPLVTIKTFLGYLEKDISDPAATAKDLGYIHDAADKMGRLLDELLALSRIGHKGNVPVDVPLQDVVQEALRLVAGQIAERGVCVGITREPILLHGDRPRLVEAFQNLLDNAVKFLGDQPAPRIEVGAEHEGGKIVLFVRDNGKGIDPRHKARLFGLFEKLDPHTPGSGMGLATVRRIVEAHGGQIEALSDGPGKGSTFRFTLAETQWSQPS